ncbi:MAG: OmpA family protein [Treponemataceae bacterium]|nr:OmpA family protein [Treponemataceae bacterium]
MKQLRTGIAVVCAALFAATAVAQTAVQFTYTGEDSTYVLVERSNLRRYDNGRYSGVMNREVRSYVYPIDPPADCATSFKKDAWFTGNFMVYEGTRTAGSSSVGLDTMMPATFHISPAGKLTVVPNIVTGTLGYGRGAKAYDTGFPSYRSFPSFPAQPVSPGQSWTAPAERSVDPLNHGIFTRLAVQVQYTYVDDQVYKGVPCRHLTAKWATRYGEGTLSHDYDGDPSLVKATGTHTADIMVSIETGAAIVISDQLDETFLYDDGSQVQFKGTTLLFTEYPPAVERDSVIRALNRIAKVDESVKSSAEKESAVASAAGVAGQELQPAESAQVASLSENRRRISIPGARDAESSGNTAAAGSDGDMIVEDTSAGLRLSIRNLQFAPDSDQLLAGEKNRLDQIAAALKDCGSGQFLVEGHCAATGNPVGEKALSIARAKRIVDELTRRGIGAERFLYIGYGADRPVADNVTTAGKAANRRVEITILE